MTSSQVVRMPNDGPPVTPATTELDALLNEICGALQISPTQYKNAEEKYQNVGKWLAAPESPIAALKPEIYPQGSMALQTTVRPWTDEDSYDLDLVLRVEPTSDDPMTLYRLVSRRLQDSERYRRILKEKRRCLALNFVGDDHAFHMDILPARVDVVRGGTCIEIPDKKTPETWQPSNPQGYRSWFENQAVQAALVLEARKQVPLPDNDPAHAKAVLKRAVQLLKRRRDLMIREDELSPRSVLLTTLAGMHYTGVQHVGNALYGILAGIKRDIEAAAPRRIEVCNPANEGESFCESFKTDDHYGAFVAFIDRFLTEVHALLRTTGFAQLEPVLAEMFGERMTKRALLEYGNRITAHRDGGLRLDARAAGLALGRGTGAATSSRISAPRNTFFGE
jgi:hypothetical protein